jgi:anti-anti-sigma factor
MLQFETSSHHDVPSLRLNGELTIHHATEAKDRLSSALDELPALRLELSGLNDMDTAGVQLLAWLKQEARRRGKTLGYVAHSPVVVEVFDLLQVTSVFGDPILVAPSVS